MAKAVDIPIIVYNIPGRTGTNILPDTMARLASIETVVGVKESTGSLQQVQEMIKLCGDQFTVLSGDDWATLPLLAVGGKGVISVTANIAPRQVATVINEWEKGAWPLPESSITNSGHCTARCSSRPARRR